MWLGADDDAKDRSEMRKKRTRRIEASGDCLAEQCPRFLRFMDDIHRVDGEPKSFVLRPEHYREAHLINAIDDPETMMRAYVDMFRGLGFCALYIAEKYPSSEVRNSLPPDDCVPLSVRFGARDRLSAED